MAGIGFPHLEVPFTTPSNGRLTQPWYRLLLDIYAAVVGHTGEVILFAGPTVPQNALQCNGAAVSRTTYSLLFSVIGTTYGPGDGSTTFNLPTCAAPFAGMMYVILT